MTKQRQMAGRWGGGESHWGDQSRWPKDLPGYIFLGRAFEQIGKARFGDKWDQEMQPPPKNDSDEEIDAWERLSDEAEKEEEEREAQVRSEIAQKCQTGELETALRPISGGALHELKSEDWYADDFEWRFDKFQMSMTDPFNHHSSRNLGWIYVKEDSLIGCLLSQPFAERNGIGDIHLSPYLKVMLAVTKKMKITKTHQPTKKEVIYEIEIASTGLRLSKNLKQSMATLIREPESQAGRQSKARK